MKFRTVKKSAATKCRWRCVKTPHVWPVTISLKEEIRTVGITMKSQFCDTEYFNEAVEIPTIYKNIEIKLAEAPSSICC